MVLLLPSTEFVRHDEPLVVDVLAADYFAPAIDVSPETAAAKVTPTVPQPADAGPDGGDDSSDGDGQEIAEGSARARAALLASGHAHANADADADAAAAAASPGRTAGGSEEPRGKSLRVKPPFLFASLQDDSHFFAFPNGAPMVARVEQLRAFARKQHADAPVRTWEFAYHMYAGNKAALALAQPASSYRPVCDGAPSRISKLNTDCLVSADVSLLAPHSRPPALPCSS